MNRLKKLHDFFRKFDGIPGVCTNQDGCCEEGERCNCRDEQDINDLNLIVNDLSSILREHTTIKPGSERDYWLLTFEILMAYELKLKEMSNE